VSVCFPFSWFPISSLQTGFMARRRSPRWAGWTPVKMVRVMVPAILGGAQRVLRPVRTSSPDTRGRIGPLLGSTCRSVIATLLEHLTRSAMLIPLPGDHDTTTVRDCLPTAIDILPAHLARSLTWDQGTSIHSADRVRNVCDESNGRAHESLGYGSLQQPCTPKRRISTDPPRVSLRPLDAELQSVRSQAVPIEGMSCRKHPVGDSQLLPLPSPSGIGEPFPVYSQSTGSSAAGVRVRTRSGPDRRIRTRDFWRESTFDSS
jgi:hypothetical protein